MLTRRQFLKMLAVLSGSAIASACSSRIPTLTAETPTVAAARSATATRSATPTVSVATSTASPSLTSTATTAAPTATATPGATSAPMSPGLVTVKGDQFYYAGARFPINAFNYYPRVHPWRTFNIGEWEPRVTERELRLGAELGANTVRIFVDYNYSLDNPRALEARDTFFAPLAGYVRNVREFLDIAERVGLKVILTLFDSMDWSIYTSAYHWVAEEYVKEFVPPFAGDPRVLCWDLQNEPDRAIALVGNNNVIPFFKNISTLVRQMDPNHLQTIGWIDRARGRYFAELDNYLDFWCFHTYEKPERIGELIQFYKGATKKPVLLEEWGLPTGGPGPEGRYTEEDQRLHYNRVLTLLEDNYMCGSAFWILLDFPVGLAGNPPIQTDSPENHFGVFRLDYSAKPAAAELRSFWRRSYEIKNVRP